MFGKITIALGAAGLLGFGALSVIALESHGDAVQVAAQAATKGEAHGDAVSAVASARGVAARADAKADAAAREAERDADAAAKDADKDADKAGTTDKDAHGDLVATTAKSDCKAAHDTGKHKVNHGGCVSQVASKHA